METCKKYIDRSRCRSPGIDEYRHDGVPRFSPTIFSLSSFSHLLSLPPPPLRAMGSPLFVPAGNLGAGSGLDSFASTSHFPLIQNRNPPSHLGVGSFGRGNPNRSLLAPDDDLNSYEMYPNVSLVCSPTFLKISIYTIIASGYPPLPCGSAFT